MLSTSRKTHIMKCTFYGGFYLQCVPLTIVKPPKQQKCECTSFSVFGDFFFLSLFFTYANNDVIYVMAKFWLLKSSSLLDTTS